MNCQKELTLVGKLFKHFIMFKHILCDFFLPFIIGTLFSFGYFYQICNVIQNTVMLCVTVDVDAYVYICTCVHVYVKINFNHVLHYNPQQKIPPPVHPHPRGAPTLD